MCKISVIVPVYNVEKTLDRCLKSILNQTYKDFEVILVDDGSTDNSGAICDEYVKKYSNFSVIHKENEGLGPTRNAGQEKAKGEYVYHCDSDDWLDENLLKDSLERIEKDNSDLVVFGYTTYVKKNDKLIEQDSVTLKDTKIEDSQLCRKLYLENYTKSFALLVSWNRLYRKNFLDDNNIKFPALRRGQDVAYSFNLFDYLSKMSIIDKPYYNYVIESSVYKGKTFLETFNNIYQNYELSIDSLKKWNLANDENILSMQDYFCIHIANFCSFAIVEKYKKDRKQIYETLFSEQNIAIFNNSLINNNSKFMKYFKKAVIKKNKFLLLLICKIQRKKLK